jgi:hypothetical protein
MSETDFSRKFVWSIVTAQMLVQIGAFSLPALSPAYIDQWHLKKTEAGSLVGISTRLTCSPFPCLSR